MKTYQAGRIIDDLRKYEANRRARREWGNWTYDARLKVLRHAKAPSYEVNVEAMTTPAAMLDWIFQVSAKRWVSRDDAGDLIEALRVLVDPQATLCPWGMARGRAK